MMLMPGRWRISGLFLLLCILAVVPAMAATAPLAVFPLLNVSQGPNGIDLAYTSELISRLEKKGINVSPLATVISFMDHNRMRTAGQIESYHLSQIREELGAAYVLLGAVIQSKEVPAFSLGVTLSLIRTYDARTIWSYSGALSSADLRKPLGIGEADSIAMLQALLADEITTRWPEEIVAREELSSATIDSLLLEPKVVKPGDEIHATVQLRDRWTEGRTPRVFFRVDDQLYASSFSPDANSYETTWIAGEKDGRFTVNLLLEWPLYGRTESLPLGSYLVDGVMPVIALDLRGEALAGETPVFTGDVQFLPRLIVRKPLARWRITIKDSNDTTAATQEEDGNLPTRLTWSGAGEAFVSGMGVSDGIYKAIFDVWDEAGNTATASALFELNRSKTRVAVKAEKSSDEVVVGLQRDTKVPLAYWRLEMWSEKGRLLKEAEGEELPPTISVKLQPGEQDEKIDGVLVTEDVLGNRVRMKIDDFFPPPAKEVVKEEDDKSATENWVNDF